jgi:cardiolipin synthase
VALLKDGRQTYPAMLEAIGAARRSICLETYILRDDQSGLIFLEALMERARAGVEVLLMYDDWGSDLSEATLSRAKDAGVKVKAFNQVRLGKRRSLARLVGHLSRRNHRKSLIVDGNVAFTGGLNICDDSAATEDGGRGWRDTHVRITGPAAHQLEGLFLDTWKTQRGPPVDARRFVRETPLPASLVQIVGNDFSLSRKHIRRAYLEAISNATSRVFLTNAYFLPPARLVSELIRAVQRGVRVAVILAAETDVPLVRYAARGLYPKLLRHGIEIYEWSGRVLHAKTAVVDASWSTVGTSNLDPLSLRKNLEVNAIVRSAEFSAALERMFLEDAARCERITIETIASYGWPLRLLSFVAYPLRHWL